MNYPSGEEIQTGDQVYWDGRTRIAFIHSVLSAREAEEFTFSGEGVFLAYGGGMDDQPAFFVERDKFEELDIELICRNEPAPDSE